MKLKVADFGFDPPKRWLERQGTCPPRLECLMGGERIEGDVLEWVREYYKNVDQLPPEIGEAIDKVFKKAVKEERRRRYAGLNKYEINTKEAGHLLRVVSTYPTSPITGKDQRARLLKRVIGHLEIALGEIEKEEEE